MFFINSFLVDEVFKNLVVLIKIRINIKVVGEADGLSYSHGIAIASSVSMVNHIPIILQEMAPTPMQTFNMAALKLAL